MLILQHHGLIPTGGSPPHINAGLGQQPAAKPQPESAVVIACNIEHRHPHLPQPGQDFIKQGHSLHRRYAPVIYIPCNDYGFRFFLPDQGKKFIYQQFLLVACQHRIMEAPPQVPVCRVDKAHCISSKHIQCPAGTSQQQVARS